jgi:hypothetical protein
VTDAITTARTARESLARGLSALQSDPNVPPVLLELAAPIAQSMGMLHQIEQSGGAQLQPHADMALNNVRTALQALQAQPASHPAVAKAMEAVASSLGLVHALTRMGAAPPQGAQQAQFAATAFAPQPGAPQPGAPHPGAPPYIPPPPPHMAGVAAQAGAGPGFPPPPRAQQAPQHAPPPPPQAFQPPQQQPAAAVQPTAPAFQPPPQAAHAHVAPPQAPPPPQAQHAPPPQAQRPQPGADVPPINADLGTHSPTNFYKGLSGNDIIDHGGLFVSTYMVPKIGTPVRLKISLPGGYEFEANAIVAWSREPSDAGNDAPPGFGAKFTQITQEARQLIYRYVRNREPLFHDDL